MHRVPRDGSLPELDTWDIVEAVEEDDSFCNGIHGIENAAYGISKTNSLPVNATLAMWNENIISSALAVSPEDLASQLTLLDFPVFAAIRSEELSTCAWNKKNKATVAPNVVAFTRRFNQVTFWTVQEVLNGATAKRRADIMVHFIKVARKLHEINNLHSLFAVISGLQSVSIFRLSQSWSYLPKKDKHSFDKMAQLFYDDNNWSTLREYMNELKPPCIPYLGIFLTDLVYLDVAQNGECSSSKLKIGEIINYIAAHQKSDYSYILPLQLVQEYLASTRYIEELQKFYEDDQYKLSLKLEPPSSTSSMCGSKESMKFGEPCTSSGTLPRGQPGPVAHAIQSKFHLGHRKTQSLGTKFRSTSLPRNFHKGTCIAGIYLKNNASERGMRWNNTVSGRVNLLDDTVIENPETTAHGTIPKLRSLSDLNTGTLPTNLENIYQGAIRRKTILKCGRKPTVSSWQKFWVQIWSKSLVYYASKTFKGMFNSTRSNFKHEPCKIHTLEGWTMPIKVREGTDSFLIANPKTETIYKFRAESHELAVQWFSRIQSEMSKSQKPFPANLMSFE